MDNRQHFPAAGFLNVLTSFLNVSAHFEVQFFSAFGRKKSAKNKGGLSRGIALMVLVELMMLTMSRAKTQSEKASDAGIKLIRS